MRRTSLLSLASGLLMTLVVAGCGSSGPVDDGRVVTNQALNPSAARTLEPTPAPPSVGPPARPDSHGAVTFAGVTVTHALKMADEPDITSRNASPAAGLLVQDLIVGQGGAATPTSTAVLHYKGALYSDGTVFDTDYNSSEPPPQQLGKAIAGFAQGVGGTDGVTAMKVGGRRLIVFPAALGYGPIPVGKIPAHASLVFVVDLLGVS